VSRGETIRRGPGYRNSKKRYVHRTETDSAVSHCPCFPSAPHFVRSLFVWLVLISVIHETDEESGGTLKQTAEENRTVVLVVMVLVVWC